MPRIDWRRVVDHEVHRWETMNLPGLERRIGTLRKPEKLAAAYAVTRYFGLDSFRNILLARAEELGIGGQSMVRLARILHIPSYIPIDRIERVRARQHSSFGTRYNQRVWQDAAKNTIGAQILFEDGILPNPVFRTIRFKRRPEKKRKIRFKKGGV